MRLFRLIFGSPRRRLSRGYRHPYDGKPYYCQCGRTLWDCAESEETARKRREKNPDQVRLARSILGR